MSEPVLHFLVALLLPTGAGFGRRLGDDRGVVRALARVKRGGSRVEGVICRGRWNEVGSHRCIGPWEARGIF